MPPEAAAQMEVLYGSLYASLPQLQLPGPSGHSSLTGASTYIAGSGSTATAIFLYKHDGDTLRVINEGMRIRAADAERFAMRMFARMPALRCVHWHAIRMEGSPRQWPVSRFDCSEDIMLDLPTTEAAYLQALGKATRKSLRQRLTRTRGLSHDVIGGDEAAAPALVTQIIAFNHARMANKARRSALDPDAVTKLQQLIRARGMVGGLYIDGKLCAGTLACRIADDVYSLVNAHDPCHDRIGLGNLCRHLMILHAIRIGARRFHLMGGNYASKRSCRAQRYSLQHVVLHRDRWQQWRDVPMLARWWLTQSALRLRRRVDDRRHGLSA